MITEAEKHELLAEIIAGKPIQIACQEVDGSEIIYRLENNRVTFLYRLYDEWTTSIAVDKESFLKLITNGEVMPLCGGVLIRALRIMK